MIKEINGIFKGDGKRFTIVMSRFNSFITDRLLEGAVDGLTRHGVSEKDITVVRVPGAFEIPLAVQKACDNLKQDCIITLGAVIRGETPHFDFVASEVSKGVANISLAKGVPIIFGVLTTDTIEQAEVRAGAKGGNKGFEAALSGLELLSVVESMQMK